MYSSLGSYLQDSIRFFFLISLSFSMLLSLGINHFYLKIRWKLLNYTVEWILKGEILFYTCTKGLKNTPPRHHPDCQSGFSSRKYIHHRFVREKISLLVLTFYSMISVKTATVLVIQTSVVDMSTLLHKLYRSTIAAFYFLH